MASTRRRKSTKITKYEKTIEDLFKNEMGLLVDKVKPGGGGKQNDTNTARKVFFRNCREYSRNTGVNENLIRRFYLILQSI